MYIRHFVVGLKGLFVSSNISFMQYQRNVLRMSFATVIIALLSALVTSHTHTDNILRSFEIFLFLISCGLLIVCGLTFLYLRQQKALFIADDSSQIETFITNSRLFAYVALIFWTGASFLLLLLDEVECAKIAFSCNILVPFYAFLGFRLP